MNSETSNPPNSIILCDIDPFHPNDEIKIRFSSYKTSNYPLIIIREPLNSPMATIIFKTSYEAKKACNDDSDVVLGIYINYNDVNNEIIKPNSSLPIPINEKNWLISPPPSPPKDWKPITEGNISHTLPFYDLPNPELDKKQSKEQEKDIYIVYTPKKDIKKKTKLPIPSITSCNY